ncbi:MAG: hypothetical protein HY597_03085 [Candidatus Omnitrophica bacterium]|nr:hypothetical protein [Candidatus Omnitrophota bacterium]
MGTGGGKGLAGLLLVVGGLINAVPALYRFLTGLTGRPWIQVVVGALSVFVGLKCLKCCKGGECKSTQS